MKKVLRVVSYIHFYCSLLFGICTDKENLKKKTQKLDTCVTTHKIHVDTCIASIKYWSISNRSEFKKLSKEVPIKN